MAASKKHKRKVRLRELDLLIRALRYEAQLEARNPYECGLTDPKTVERVDLGASVDLLLAIRSEQ